jgi:hypothetical protein
MISRERRTAEDPLEATDLAVARNFFGDGVVIDGWL